MSVNATCIPQFFAGLLNHMVAVSHFPYPHEMPYVHLYACQILSNVFDEPICEDGPLLEAFLLTVKAVTYDRAKANYCFSPDPKASGIRVAEKNARTQTCEKHKSIV